MARAKSKSFFLASLMATGILFPQNIWAQNESLREPAPSTPSTNSPSTSDKAPSALLQRLSSALSSGTFTAADLDLIWMNRALLHGSLGEFTKASPEIPDTFPVLFRVAQLCAYTGQYALQKSTSERRAESFSLGYQVASRAIELEPNRVEGHFWFAINLSGYALEQGSWKVLTSGRRILQALDTANAILPDYYFAGPLRARGRLVFKMPGFPFSFGDSRKGLADLRKAAEKSPDARLNHFFLAEALAELGETEQAREALAQARSAPELMGNAEEAALNRLMSEFERTL